MIKADAVSRTRAGSAHASAGTAFPLATKTPRLKTLQLAEITSLPYNLRTISSHVTGEKREGHPSGDKVDIHRGT